MFTISDAVAKGFTGGYSMQVTAEVFRGSVRVLDSSQLWIEGGTLSIDGTASTRRRITLDVVVKSTDLIPINATDALAPFGNELRVKVALTFDNGATAEIPLGVFRISEPFGSESGDRSMTITGFDRSKPLSLSILPTPYQVPAGTNYTTAIKAFIDSRRSGLIWQAMTTAHTTPPLLFDVGSDPWEHGLDMAQAMGADLFFDVYGQPNLKLKPNPATAPPVWSFVEGVDSTILSVSGGLSDDPGYNGVAVIGEPSVGLPVFSVTWDDNRTSATYYKGEYGERLAPPIKSQYIWTQAQADEAATAELRAVLGIAEKISFTATANYALDAGDIVQVRREAARIDDVYVIESIELPIKGTDVMSVVARRRKSPT